MSIKIESESQLRQFILKDGINLFLGAGFSYNALNTNNEKIPLGENLKNELISEFSLQNFNAFNLPQISAILKKKDKSGLIGYLKTKFLISDFDEKYLCLSSTNIRNIFTTNIDDLVEKIFSYPKSKHMLFDVETYGTIDNKGIDFYKLHGSINYSYDKELLFTPEELNTLFSRDPSFFHAIALKIASHPTIFWGYKLEDGNVLSLLAPGTIKSRPAKPKWILITPEPENDPVADYFSLEGFNIIRGYTIDLLDFFCSILNESEHEEEPTDENSILGSFFPTNFIPSILRMKHPVRPLELFFSGDDPVWNDIIEEKIIKLSFYKIIIEKIKTNKEIFITGGVGCGKSTLLMQLAVDPIIQGYKFHFSSITLVQAIKLVSLLEHIDSKKYIFIDNLRANLDAFLYLKSKNNYHLVVAERDINYDLITHKGDFRNDQIIDTTELTHIDLQNIAKLAQVSSLKKLPNNKNSLYEIAYFLWSGEKLQDRIKSLIIELEKHENKDLLEFFALMTYVRYCGIYASMDMLLLYYSNNSLINYETIYSYVSNLKSLIDNHDNTSGYQSDYREQLFNTQDFFTLRSKLFADLAIEVIPSKTLAKVMLGFVNNVHRDIINRYDYFQQLAFDANIAELAFRNLDEGIDFYEKVIVAYPSAYRYQQFALYLLKHNRKDLAWDEIEQAYNLSKKHHWSLSIKNTHAYILFKINIDQKEDSNETVLTTLKYTFEAIEECISKDMRKLFHVTTYANNAIDFYKRYRDTKNDADAKEFLQKAHFFLEEEENKKEFNSKRNRSHMRWIKNELNRYLK